ncbi:MAG: MBL fold metallo-hydrolase [Desulfobulbus sp.]|jgi:7,8-dihydropterin-6-yl-methyl-4-(beta-D-ribofuranosyl)aminobenzene 5'-phosphate synthase|uniref:MBL fold metallo-hydrolase n=1 Tax=Desulfobulbus sp. TaxID=895 RepID=UPI002851FAC4|nr:MBL fold metallo-hydrolase [Desulfobulbus sp.]MDR2549525.1 MBL fold metallo-hydrolase [Desulfobulbus sp.]
MHSDTVGGETRIAILVDNEAGAGLEAEHGFSLWLETDGRRILFDTGQGGVLLVNAPILGIDPTRADHLVLSHGHYDHSGGLASLLQQGHGCTLHCHPGVVSPRYSIRNRTAKSLQMPSKALAALERFPLGQLRWVQQPVQLGATVGLTGPIGRETIFEDAGGPFFLDRAGHRPDPVDDDLALWVRSRDGLIVCVGCAHAGLINTLRQVQRLNGGMRIQAVIGGFHLLNANVERLEQTIDALHRLAPDLIVPCHCTGEAAVEALRRAFGKRCRPGMAGMICRFEAAGQ